MHIVFFSLFIFILNGCMKPYYRCMSPNCESGVAKLESKYCDVYEGEVKNGEPFGFGTMNYTGDQCSEKGYTRALGNTLSYKGNWGPHYDKIMKKSYIRWMGDGEVTTNNGFKIIGKFEDKDCVKDSKGIIELADGKKLNAVCDSSLFCVDNCQNGTGKKYSVDGRIFEGVYANGKLNGKCKKVEINHTEEGICKDGFLVSGKILCPNRPNSNYCDDALGRHLRIMKALKKDIPEPNAIKVVLVDPKD